MGPNHFGRVPIVLDGSNLFWLGSNHFRQVQILKISHKKLFWTWPKWFGLDQNDLEPIKIIWTRPKQFVSVQNNLDGPKSFLSYRKARHSTITLLTIRFLLGYVASNLIVESFKKEEYRGHQMVSRILNLHKMFSWKILHSQGSSSVLWKKALMKLEKASSK